MRIFGTALAASALLLLAGCETSPDTEASSASMAALNSHCPMMADAEVDPDVEMAMYGGHHIGFCCTGCRGKWERLSERDKDAFVNAQMMK